MPGTALALNTVLSFNIHKYSLYERDITVLFYKEAGYNYLPKAIWMVGDGES